MHIHYCYYFIPSLSILDVATFLLIDASTMEPARNFYGHATQDQYKCFFDVAAYFTVILWLLLHENILLGSGVTAFNITFNGDSSRQIGYFNGTNSNIGIGEGLLLTTGDVSIAVGPNDAPDSTSIIDGPILQDPDLNQLLGPTFSGYDILIYVHIFIQLK